MAPSRYFMSVRAGDTLVVAPSRHIGSLAITDLLHEQSGLIDEIRDPKIRAVIIDFENCEEFGSPMLDTLCLAWKHVLESGATMALCNLSEIGREILSKAELDALWLVYPSREVAVVALRSSGPAEVLEGSTDTRIAKLSEDPSKRLEVLEVGPQTVVGFGGTDLPIDHALGRYLDEIHGLIDHNSCRDFSFDMTGVKSIPSGFLGLMASVLKKGVHVSVRNPSPEVREVLMLAKYDGLVKISRSD